MSAKHPWPLATWLGVIYVAGALIASGGLVHFFGYGTVPWLIPGIAGGMAFGWELNDFYARMGGAQR